METSVECALYKMCIDRSLISRKFFFAPVGSLVISEHLVLKLERTRDSPVPRVTGRV